MQGEQNSVVTFDRVVVRSVDLASVNRIDLKCDWYQCYLSLLEFRSLKTRL
jgi:hypothetical protein